MTESRPRPPRAAVLALVVGLGLAVLAGFGGWVAVLSGLLAQPAVALAVSWWRQTRMPVAGLAAAGREGLPLLALWAAAAAAAALLLAWPLVALLDGGSLGAAVAVSAMASAVLLGLWRTWPACWRW